MSTEDVDADIKRQAEVIYQVFVDEDQFVPQRYLNTIERGLRKLNNERYTRRFKKNE